MWTARKPPDCLRHIYATTPFGVKIDFEAGVPANGSAVPVGGPGYDAFSAAMEYAVRQGVHAAGAWAEPSHLWRTSSSLDLN